HRVVEERPLHCPAILERPCLHRKAPRRNEAPRQRHARTAPALEGGSQRRKKRHGKILYPTARNRAAAPAARPPLTLRVSASPREPESPPTPGRGRHQAEKSATSRPCPNRPPPSSST